MGNNISKQIEEMEIGDSLELPAIKMRSVRALAYSIGFMHGRRYTTHSDRERRVIIVNRVS